MSGQGVFGNSVPSAQLCYEPKIALKNKVFLKSKRRYLSIKYLQEEQVKRERNETLFREKSDVVKNSIVALA